MVKNKRNKGRTSDSTKSKTKRTKNPQSSNTSNGINKSQRSLQYTRKTCNSRKKRTLDRKDIQDFVCGKPMPPLAELERMYEDSDDEMPETTMVDNKVLENSSSPTPIEALTPNIAQKYVDDLLKILNGQGPPPPKRKYKEPNVPYIVGCNERQRIPEKHNCKVFKGDNYGNTHKTNVFNEDEKQNNRRSPGFNVNESSLSKSISNARTNEIASKLLSYESEPFIFTSDSDDTVIYELDSPKHRFSPKPSSSTDMEIISRNDQKFIESCTVASRSSNETHNKVEPVCKTEFAVNCQLSINEEIKNFIEEVDLTCENNVTSPLISNIDNDDIEIIEQPCEIIEIDDNNIGVKIKPDISITSENNVSNNNTIHESIHITKPDGNLKFKSTLKRETKSPLKAEEYCKPFNANIIDEIDLTNIYDVISEKESIINKYINKHNNLGTIKILNTNSVISVSEENTNTHENVTNMQFSSKSNQTTNTHTSKNINISNKVNEFDKNPKKNNSRCFLNNTDNNAVESKKKDKNQKNNLSHNNIETCGPQILNNDISRQPFLGTCPICLNDLCRGTVGSTTCGHLFCLPCITRALKIKRKRCPTCRKKLTGLGYHPIFM